MNGMNPGLPMQAGPSGPGTSPQPPMPGPQGPMGQMGPQGPQGPMGGQPMAPMQPPPPPDPSLQVDRMLEEVNIAKHLSCEVLEEMGKCVHKGYLQDKDSKKDWDISVDEWIKLAAQKKEMKSYPWQRASNVKYPLLSTAAMQFAARAYPNLVPADGKVVQMNTIGIDKGGVKAALAEKLATHMNYQLLYDMCGWEEEMDKLLIQLPIVGCLFKKTYFDNLTKKNASKLLGVKNLIVNYWAPSIDEAYRITEVLFMTKNDIQAMINGGLYCEVDLGDPTNNLNAPKMVPVSGMSEPNTVDEATPYVLLEQHTFWDLDDDGYAEPYIITIDERTKKVLRVVARWDSDGIHLDQDGKIIYIDPVQYYTKYDFIPNPDGGFYSIGFGHLLGALNESANTIMNQLIDAGTLSNMQSGFIGKGLRMKQGESRFQPGEWKQVNATGDDLRKQIVPLPIAPPSSVLFQLLGMVIESTEKLASVAEIFTGKMPGQNTPATTTMATIEQGMKVFTAIYKRIYRSQAQEFKKLFRLNGLFQENIDRAIHVLDQPITIQDYDRKSYDVCPSADPTAVSSTQKLLKAQALMELLPLGTINPQEVTKRILEAHEQPNIEALMQVPQKGPDPKTQQIQMEMQQSAQEHEQNMQAAQQKLQVDAMKANQEQMASDQSMRMDKMERMLELFMKALEHSQEAESAGRSHVMDLVKAGQLHSQEMQHNQEGHQQAMTHKEEQANARKQATMAGMAGQSRNRSSKGSD